MLTGGLHFGPKNRMGLQKYRKSKRLPPNRLQLRRERGETVISEPSGAGVFNFRGGRQKEIGGDWENRPF